MILILILYAVMSLELFGIEERQKLLSLSKEELVQRIDLLNAAVSEFKEAIENREKELGKLRIQLGIQVQERLDMEDYLLIIRNKLFGASSERSEREVKEPKTQDQKRKKRVQLPSLQYPTLLINSQRIDFIECPTCTLCGATMTKMEQVESSETIEVITRSFFIKRTEREKYRCSSCHGCIKTAPPPPRIVPGGSYSDDFAIEVAVG